MSRERQNPVSEEDLHAFLDGQLAPERAAAVEAWLESHPESAREIEAWRENDAALGELLSQFHHGGAEDIPEAPAAPRARLDGWPRIAAALVIAFGLGGGAGYLLHAAWGALPLDGQDSGWLAAAARDIHLTYVREVRHPVEIGADQEDHLVTWLSNRIDRAFTAPSLADLGFTLVGGRLVPVEGNPGAMLMYENAAGDRATILLARNVGARDTAFHFSHTDGVNTLRWIDGPMAYAISGFLDRPALEAISQQVYTHFAPGYGAKDGASG
jgi:anti-sigma factor RsiW